MHTVTFIAGTQDVLVSTVQGSLFKLNSNRKLSRVGVDQVSALECHPSAPWALAGTLNGKLFRIDPTSNMVEEVETLKSTIWDIDFDGAGKQAVITTDDDRLVIVNCEQLKIDKTIQGNNTQIALCLVHSGWQACGQPWRV